MTMVRWIRYVTGRTPGANEQDVRTLLRRPQEDLNRGSWAAEDIYSNGQHELMLKAELPDMKEEQIELTVEDNTLTLRGERKLDTKSTEEQFHRIERSYGPFARSSRCRRRSTRQGPRRVQGRHADRPAAAARGSQPKRSRSKSPRNVTA